MDNIFFEVIEDSTNDLSPNKTHYTGVTSLRTKFIPVSTEIIAKIKALINEIEPPSTSTADELELEFSLAINANGSICVLSGSSTLGIKVKMTWKKK